MSGHLFVTQDYPPDLGGMARRHVELARRYPDMAVSTVAAAAAEAGRAFDAGERYPLHRQPFSARRANRFANQLRWARWLSARVEAGGAAVLHCGNLRPAGSPVLWVHRRRGTPFVLYVNGYDLLRERQKAEGNPLKRRVARALFARAAGVVANSAYTAGLARELAAWLGAESVPVAAIDLGTDPAHFTPARDRGRLRERHALGDAPLLVTVARLVGHKGQDDVIRAVAALAGEFPALRYLVVGEGSEAAALRALADSLGVGDRVVLAGALPDDEVAEAYATADLYVGLSRVQNDVVVEGFGISFVEAAACGTPSVAGDSGGVRAAVRDGETGLVVTPGDAGAAAAAIGRLLRDEPARLAMGRRARALVESHYNWDRVAAETAAFVAGVVPAARAAS